MLTNFATHGIIAKRSGECPSENGRVVELVDSLDSGSSVHYGRAGSSPASPTKEDSRKAVSFFASRSSMKQMKPLDFQEKRRSRGIFVLFSPVYRCSLHLLPIPVDPASEKGGAFVRFLTYVHMRYLFL